MMRPLLALSAGILCALLGLRRSREALSRRARLERWPRLLRHLALLLREEAGSLPEVLLLAACEDNQPDRLMHALAQSMTAQPLQRADLLPELSQLPADEAQLLRRMLPRLTQGSRDSRIQAVEGCAAAFDLLYGAVREKTDGDARMWRQLGLLGGACLTLWLM